MAKHNAEAARDASEFAQSATELEFLKRVQAMRQDAATKQMESKQLADEANTILFNMYFLITQRETVLLHKAIAEKESASA